MDSKFQILVCEVRERRWREWRWDFLGRLWEIHTQLSWLTNSPNFTQFILVKNPTLISQLGDQDSDFRTGWNFIRIVKLFNCILVMALTRPRCLFCDFENEKGDEENGVPDSNPSQNPNQNEENPNPNPTPEVNENKRRSPRIVAKKKKKLKRNKKIRRKTWTIFCKYLNLSKDETQSLISMYDLNYATIKRKSSSATTTTGKRAESEEPHSLFICCKSCRRNLTEIVNAHEEMHKIIAGLSGKIIPNIKKNPEPIPSSMRTIMMNYSTYRNSSHLVS